MAQKWVKLDPTNRRMYPVEDVPGIPITQIYDVDVGGQVNFDVIESFLAGTKIVIRVNGVIVFEGASADYERNVTLNRIEFKYTVPQYAQVEICIYK